MQDWQVFFKGKKITVMGVGLLGGVEDIRFLAEMGAELTVTDLKSEGALQTSLEALKEFPNINYTLGRHDLADFHDRDLIIKAPATPDDSPYIAEAKKNKIPVTMWAALFARFARQKGVPIVGVTGTRGKTTVSVLIAEILKADQRKVIAGGNIPGSSILSKLPELSKDTFVVLELDSWKIQGFGEEGISPNVGVFTTFYPDHLNYYHGDMQAYFDDKALIFLNQTPEDVLILGEQAAPLLKEYGYHNKIQAKTVIAGAKDIPKKWMLKIPGEHNRMNAGIAVAAARVLGVDDTVIEATVTNFSGVPGRLQLEREIDGIKIYNDTTSTTPDATIAALRAVGSDTEKNILLIMGGADKELDMSSLTTEIPKYCKQVFLLQGTGTEKIRSHFSDAPTFENLENAVRAAREAAGEGDTILFSPAFASFGMFKNEYDRGAQFEKILREL